jgi:anti-sigma regulatory factor (Ser/Thr protein kinase)
VSTINGHSATGDSLTGMPEFDSGADPAFRDGPATGVIDEAHWQLGSNLELAPLPSAVPCARAHARLVLAEWELARLSNDVELIVSELVTNGVRAAAGLTDSWFAGLWIPGAPPVRLWLSSDCRQVLVQVWDGNDELPVRRETGPEADGGRGLLLVQSLSIERGLCRPVGCSGKVVWALLA